MAITKVISDIKVDLKINLELTLQEAEALNEMVKYGSKAFLEGYYKQLGKSYLQPYEKGVISLFETVKSNLPNAIEKINKHTKTLVEIIKDIRSS